MREHRFSGSNAHAQRNTSEHEIMPPAGYRVSGHWNFGLATMVLYLMAVFLVPVSWPRHTSCRPATY